MVPTETSSVPQVIKARVLFARTFEEGTFVEVIDDKEPPTTQELEINHVGTGTWTSVGLTFVNEGHQVLCNTGEVYDEKGSWYRRYVPDNEMDKRASRIPHTLSR